MCPHPLALIKLKSGSPSSKEGKQSVCVCVCVYLCRSMHVCACVCLNVRVCVCVCVSVWGVCIKNINAHINLVLTFPGSAPSSSPNTGGAPSLFNSPCLQARAGPSCLPMRANENTKNTHSRSHNILNHCAKINSPARRRYPLIAPVRKSARFTALLFTWQHRFKSSCFIHRCHVMLKVLEGRVMPTFEIIVK